MDAKGLLITGSIGLVGVGGIGYAGYQAISSKSETQEANNILNALKKEGYTPIAKNSTKFETILTDYKKVIANKQALKFDDFTGDNKNRKQAKDILWEHCQTAFNSNVSEEIFNKAKKWCVEPIDVKQLLINQELSILDTASEDSGIKAKWEAKIQNYRGLAQDKKIFKNLDLGAGTEKPSDEHLKKIKEKCNAIGAIFNHNKEYEGSLKNFKDWCLDK